jgi:TonB family protein
MVTCLAAYAARADPASTPAEVTAPPAQPVDAAGSETPKPADKHVCDPNKYYTQAILKGLQGATEVRFNIAPDGTVANVWVLTSSGSDELDNAAIECAKQWHYKPAMKGGVAVSVPWHATVIFKLPGVAASWPNIVTEGEADCRTSDCQGELAQAADSGPVHPGGIGGHVCNFRSSRSYALGPPRALTNSATTVQFEITPDGSVTDIAVTKSSGDTDLDNHVVECAKEWRYKPAMKDGVAVSVPWTVTVNWRSVGFLPPIYWENVVLALQKCAKKPAPTEDQLKDIGKTVLTIQFGAGTMPDTSLVTSSGNKELDDRALACVHSLSADVVEKVPDKERDEMAFNWKLYRLWATW